MAVKKKTGRKTKYTKQRVSKILEAIEKGYPFHVAARLGGISPATYYDWIHNKPEFSDRVEESTAKGEAILIDDILQDKDWKAKRYMLALRNPIYRDQLSIDIPDLASKLSSMSSTKIKQIAEEYMQKRKSSKK